MRALTDLSDDELLAVAKEAPPLEQFDDEQLTALAVHQGLMQPQEAEQAVVEKKRAVRGAELERRLPPVPTDEELLSLPAEAIESRFVGRELFRAALTRGGRAGDVAAQVVTPMAGAVAGGAAGNLPGAIVGGAAGGAAGDSLAQARQYFRGERDAVSKGELVAATVAGGVPLGPLVLPAGRPVAQQLLRAAGRRAAQGAGIAVGSTATGQLIDTGQVDLQALAATGLLGAVLGGAFGSAELGLQRALTLRAVRRTPEFRDFQGSDDDLIAAVRSKLAAEEPTAPAEINVTGTADDAARATPEVALQQLTDAELVAQAKSAGIPVDDAAATATAVIPTAVPEVTAPAVTAEVPPAPGVTPSGSAEAETPGGQAEIIVPRKGKGATLKVGLAPDGSSDLLTVIEQLGGVPGPGKTRSPEYDGFNAAFQSGPARLLRRAGKGGIDRFIPQLEEHGYTFATIDEFYEAVRVASEQRVKLAKQLGDLEYGAKFDLALFDNSGRKPGLKAAEAVPVDSLNQGDQFKVRGEPVRVEEVREDGTGRVRDGVTREIAPGTPIYPDRGEIVRPAAADDWPEPDPAPSPTPGYAPVAEQPKGQSDLFAGGATGGDTTFNLASTEGVDFEGALDRQAAQAGARAEAEKAQGNLFTGPRGTSAMGDPLGAPPLPPGAQGGTHADQRMPVAMDRTLPGQVDVPTVMSSLENVVRTLGGEAPIRARRFYAEARGIFKTFAATIRLREADNIPTAAHELGHAVSHFLFAGQSGPMTKGIRAGAQPGPAGQLALRVQHVLRNQRDPRSKIIVQELQALGRALYGATKPAAGYTAEGFSELVRLWLTTEDAARRAPSATAWFEKTLMPADSNFATAMRQARDHIDLWRGQGAQGRAAAQMKDPPGRLQRLREFVRENLGRQAQVEEFAPLEELVQGFRKITGRDLPAAQNPYLLASAFRKTAGPTLETWIQRGMTDLWGNITGPSLREAMSLIKPQEAEAFAHYLWARRALERWGKGKNPGMAREDAAWLRTKLETPAFIAAAQKYYTWWDGVLEYVKRASPETNGPLVDAIRATSHDYVPLARVLDPAKARAVSARAPGGGLYRFSGSGLPVKNIYLQSLLVAENLIVRAHRDLVLNSVLGLSQHENMGWLVEEVPRTRVMESVNLEKIRGQLEEYGVDLTEVPEDAILQFTSHLDQPMGTDPIVARAGKWYQIPANVYELLQGVETPSRLGWAFELLFGAPTRVFKLGTTGLRASFSLFTNPARDLPTFMLQSVADKNPAGLAAAWVRAQRDIVTAALGGKESPEWELFHQLGISTANFLGGDVQQAKREAKALFRGRAYRRLSSPVETLRDALSFSEAAPRLAELSLLAREMGWEPGQRLTPEQATVIRVAAKRVTTDFSAAGGIGRQINRAVPFYNAAVQGTRSFGRAFRSDQDVKRRSAAMLKAVLNGAMLLTLPALFNWWRNKDEEWYRMLPWRERWLYLNVDVPGGRIVQVPLPPDWGSAFATIPVALLDSWYQQDPEPAKRAFSHVFSVLNPVDWPVAAKAAKEQWQNRVDFFDRPIVPRGEIDLRPGDQRSHYSSWLATTLGDVFPESVSPRRVDAAIRQVFGGAGSDLVDAPEAFMRALGLKVKSRESEAADIPIVGRAFRRGGKFSANSKPLVDFWDDYSRYTQWHASNQRALNERRPILTPMPYKDQQYLQKLVANKPVVQMALEVAARTPEFADRQSIYRRASRRAEELVKSRPER